jgi:acetolactate synthase-1/2/3 large subunit
MTPRKEILPMSSHTENDKQTMSRREAIKAASAIAATATAATALVSSEATAASADPVKPAKQAPKMNGAQAFFKVFLDGGIETIFACPGTSEMQIIEELGQTNVNAVLGLQENVVTGMAHGYGVMADKPSLALLHVACGISNGLANLHNGRRAGAPIIVFAGGVAANHEVNNPEHQMLMRPQQIAAAATDWQREALTSDLLADCAAEALQVANTGYGKVAMVFGPAQTFWEEATILQDQPRPPIPPRRVSQSTINEIAESLLAGKKTCLLLGGHALRVEELEVAGRISAGTGAELWQDYIVARLQRGAGRVPLTRIPYVVEAGVDALKDFEQIVLVGNQIPIPTFSYKGKPLTKVPEGCAIKTLATTECDLLQALNDLADAVNAPAKPLVHQERAKGVAPTGVLNEAAICQSIVVAMPDNSIIVDEGNMETFNLPELTAGAAPHDFMQAPTGGAIGAGASVAIGASVAAPDRKVICMEGDFSLNLNIMSLWTMAKQNANVCLVILNNGGSQALRMELARVRPGEETEKALDMLLIRGPEIDYVKIAEGNGVSATRATTAEEFHQQFAAAMKKKGPHVIDAQVESAAPATIKMIRDNLVL